MTTRKELLPGVFLTSIQDGRFKTACFSLSFLRPLRAGEAAMNALLPSVLLRGSEKTPSIRAIADRLDELHGASIGALVRKKGEIQLTGLFADCLEDQYAGEAVFSHLLDFVSELLFCPRTEHGAFVPELVSQECRNLQNAMQSVLDDKSAYCERQLLRAMCRGERYACGRLGEPEELDKIDVRTLWAHDKSVLASSRVELFYLGSKSVGEAEALLQPLLAHLPRTACVPVGTNPGPQPQALRRFSEVMPLAQSRISLGFRTDVTLRSAQYPAMLLLNAMLGGGEQNRLYDGHKGILAASAGCGRTDLPAVEQEILHQLAELAAGRFSQSELETARTGLLSDLRLLCDSPGRLDEFYTGRAAEGISQSPAELAAALCAVTAEDVCAAAWRVRPDAVYTLEEA